MKKMVYFFKYAKPSNYKIIVHLLFVSKLELIKYLHNNIRLKIEIRVNT